MNLMNVLKKSAIGTMAAVITVAGTAVTVPSMNVSAETYGVNELASELKEIANLKTTVLNDLKLLIIRSTIAQLSLMYCL